jgi:hypothetical protein
MSPAASSSSESVEGVGSVEVVDVERGVDGTSELGGGGSGVLVERVARTTTPPITTNARKAPMIASRAVLLDFGDPAGDGG